MKLKIQPKETVSTQRNICCSEKRKFPTFILGIGLESVNKKIYELAPNLILQLKALVFDSGMRLNNRISFSRNLSNMNQTCFNTSYRCWSIEIWGGQVNTSTLSHVPQGFSRQWLLNLCPKILSHVDKPAVHDVTVLLMDGTIRPQRENWGLKPDVCSCSYRLCPCFFFWLCVLVSLHKKNNPSQKQKARLKMLTKQSHFKVHALARRGAFNNLTRSADLTFQIILSSRWRVEFINRTLVFARFSAPSLFFYWRSFKQTRITTNLKVHYAVLGKIF